MKIDGNAFGEEVGAIAGVTSGFRGMCLVRLFWRCDVVCKAESDTAMDLR